MGLRVLRVILWGCYVSLFSSLLFNDFGFEFGYCWMLELVNVFGWWANFVCEWTWWVLCCLRFFCGIWYDLAFRV